TGVKNLATVCSATQTSFVHISTDYVFDGTANNPYGEESSTNPMGVYGNSKLKGEEDALSVNANTLIIRTSWVYSVYGNNFVKTMLRLMQSRPDISVVADQKGSPTHATDLANAILQIIESKVWQPGIFHYSNEGVITWFDFAAAIKKITGSSCSIHPITTEQYPTPAMRPKYSVLDKSKIKNTFNLYIPNWEDSLKKCLAKMPAIKS
ncbi:MAG TPA: dTDP-4-dehydrorhamnose reductase, partial [Chitinophagaceae bacterium]|nr:dTDP-4-dehydrorhamnose reductase [Chitinophagaceae bacterium]HVG40751.1 dTDP-4-dehydrorhamnose reductase [Chitinophagaceae bacterium]